MYKQSNTTNHLYRDLFQIREFLIKDLVLKNNIERIKTRAAYSKESLIQPSNNHTLKKPFFPRASTKSPTKNFIATNDIKKNIPIKTSPIFKSCKDVKSNIKNIYNHNNNTIYYKHSYDSEIKYQNHKSYMNNYLDAKRRNSINKSLIIEEENIKFGRKLKRINSPLSKNILNQSYHRIKAYGAIAKRIKSPKEYYEKKINYVKSHLPPIFLKEKSFNKKAYFEN